MTSQLLTVEQVADLLQVSRWFVYDHGRDLGLVKVGGANRYPRERVEQYVAGRAAGRVEPLPATLNAGPCSQRSRGDRRRRVRLLEPATDLRPETGGAT